MRPYLDFVLTLSLIYAPTQAPPPQRSPLGAPPSPLHARRGKGPHSGRCLQAATPPDGRALPQAAHRLATHHKSRPTAARDPLDLPSTMPSPAKRAYQRPWPANRGPSPPQAEALANAPSYRARTQPAERPGRAAAGERAPSTLGSVRPRPPPTPPLRPSQRPTEGLVRKPMRHSPPLCQPSLGNDLWVKLCWATPQADRGAAGGGRPEVRSELRSRRTSVSPVREKTATSSCWRLRPGASPERPVRSHPTLRTSGPPGRPPDRPVDISRADPLGARPADRQRRPLSKSREPLRATLAPRLRQSALKDFQFMASRFSGNSTRNRHGASAGPTSPTWSSCGALPCSTAKSRGDNSFAGIYGG